MPKGLYDLFLAWAFLIRQPPIVFILIFDFISFFDNTNLLIHPIWMITDLAPPTAQIPPRRLSNKIMNSFAPWLCLGGMPEIPSYVHSLWSSRSRIRLCLQSKSRTSCHQNNLTMKNLHKPNEKQFLFFSPLAGCIQDQPWGTNVSVTKCTCTQTFDPRGPQCTMYNSTSCIIQNHQSGCIDLENTQVCKSNNWWHDVC